MATDRTPLIVHPILVAVAPVVFLYSRNVHAFPWHVTLLPAAVAVVLTLSLWWLVNLGFKNRARSAAVVTLVVAGIAVYGHLVAALDAILANWPNPLLTRRLLILATGLLLLAACVWVARTRRSLRTLTRLLNVVVGVFVALSLGQIVIQAARPGSPAAERPLGMHLELTEYQPSAVPTPDIYHIVLDGFAREDILAEIYDYADARLYAYLRQRGFYVAEQSHANYSQTLLSLASTFNGTYLNSLTDHAVRIPDRKVLSGMIQDNDVVRFLRRYGYRWATFGTGYGGLDVPGADLYYQPPQRSWHLTEFQNGLLRTTLYAAVERRLALIPGLRRPLREIHTGAHRSRIDLTLSQLESGFPGDTPLFIYAHVIVPHPPFIYGANGEALHVDGPFNLDDGATLHGFDPARQQQYIQRYRDQLQYVERRMIAIIEAILARSDPPPIIIVQADHGPAAELDWEDAARTNVRERLGILNAYYLPDGGDSLLYPSITPVNTYRVVLNHYFRTDLALEEDRSFYSRWENPYDFIDVTDRLTHPPPAAGGSDDGDR